MKNSKKVESMNQMEIFKMDIPFHTNSKWWNDCTKRMEEQALSFSKAKHRPTLTQVLHRQTWDATTNANKLPSSFFIVMSVYSLYDWAWSVPSSSKTFLVRWTLTCAIGDDSINRHATTFGRMANVQWRYIVPIQNCTSRKTNLL